MGVDEDEEEEPEEEDDAGDVDDGPTEPEQATLTPEEAKTWFRKGGAEFSQTLIDRIYTQFSVPDKAEGFDEVRFDWAKTDVCKKRLSDYILAKKLTAKIEDLVPGMEFVE